jgi:hypothetical protein
MDAPPSRSTRIRQVAQAGADAVSPSRLVVVLGHSSCPNALAHTAGSFFALTHSAVPRHDMQFDAMIVRQMHAAMMVIINVLESCIITSLSSISYSSHSPEKAQSSSSSSP